MCIHMYVCISNIIRIRCALFYLIVREEVVVNYFFPRLRNVERPRSYCILLICNFNSLGKQRTF